MRILIQMIVIAVLGFLFAQFLPWWSIAVAGMIGGFFWSGNRLRSFFAGFFGGFLLWSLAAIVITQMTGSNLGDRFSMLLGGVGATGLAAISGLIAGIVAGFAGMAGDSIRQLQKKQTLNDRSRSMRR